VRLDDPQTFAATIANFGGGGDSIILVGQTITADSYANGVLTLLDGTTLVGNLHFAGSYTTSDFQVASSGGNTVIRAPDVAPALQAAMAVASAAPDLTTVGGASPAASTPSAGMVADQVFSASGFAATYADLLQHSPVVAPGPVTG
jgi:hypothetical protein